MALALGGWGLQTTAALQSRIAVAEVRVDGIHSQLNSIEDKLDRVIEETQRTNGNRTVVPAPRKRQTQPSEEAPFRNW